MGPGAAEEAVIREAARDVRYLVNRGYPRESAVRYVGDHHRLPEERRFILSRVVVPEQAARERRRKAVSMEQIGGRDLHLDGYNVLITVESLLLGDPVYRCDDGMLRDVRGVFRSYRSSAVTAPALQAVLQLIAPLQSPVQALFDQQISKSGELAGMVRGMMAELGVAGTARTALDVDRELKRAGGVGGVVATGDGNIIDASLQVWDVPAEIARQQGIEVQVI
ncbi:MAG: DUF434 domain-containing protein [Methanosarcinales archaeon]|nr:DUF434 domain-containing protein [Methanosarcinales archaeon]